MEIWDSPATTPTTPGFNISSTTSRPRAVAGFVKANVPARILSPNLSYIINHIENCAQNERRALRFGGDP